jgi:N-acetylmuramoyl-L-alanine amidase
MNSTNTFCTFPSLWKNAPIAFLTSLWSGAVPAATAQQLPFVAIDVGHTARSPGATSARGRSEFEFNLRLAHVVKNELSLLAMRPVLIGDDGLMANLKRRVEVAKSKGAVFFLSIHHDSVQSHYLGSWDWQGVARRYTDRFSGYSLFVSRKNPHMDSSLRCAREIGWALQAAGMVASAHHAEPIPGENRPWADRAAGVYYFDELVVLRDSTMPAVLLEAGVIVHRGEEMRLRERSVQTVIAQAVGQGLARCGVVR